LRTTLAISVSDRFHLPPRLVVDMSWIKARGNPAHQWPLEPFGLIFHFRWHNQ
jgi:hypothetical protein